MAYTSTYAPNQHLKGNKNFIPQIYSAKLQEKFYATAITPAIANTDWEGEISGYGDKVIIRTVPTVKIKDWTTSGGTVTYQPLAGTSGDDIYMTEALTLTIDKAKYYAFTVDYIDEFMSDLNIIDMVTQDAAMQMSIQVDKEIFQFIASRASTSPDYGYNALEVKKMAAFQYGSGNANATATVVDKLLEAGQLLDEKNVPRDGKRFVVLNPGMARILKNSDLKSALITGDGISPLRNGLIGEIDGMKIYVSTNMPNASTNSNSVISGAEPGTFGDGENCPVLIGHEVALTFASQFIKHEMLPLTDRFGYGVKGLQVYGHQIVKPEALIVLPVYA